MTMIFKENEGISQISSTPEVPEWSALGSRPPRAENGNYFLKSLELSGGNKDSTHFTVFPELVKTINNVPSSFQPAASMEHLQGHFKLGLGQPQSIIGRYMQVCAQYPYKEEQLYGIYPVLIEGQRMMVPLSTGINGGGPIFVNVKQYNAIVRRRLSRAKAESKINEEMKTRKPYMHLSRHLHAIRRQRGSGGRFLRTKSEKADVHPVQYSGSGSSSSSPTSYLYHHFELGVGNYLKV